MEDKDTYSVKDGNFKVKLKEFRIEVDKNHRIKDYYSDLEVIEGDKSFTKTIEVNNPLEYKGFTFYQSNWGVLGLRVSVMSPSGNSLIEVPLDDYGEPAEMYNFFQLSENEIIKVNEFYPDGLEEKNEMKNMSNFTGNPAVSLYVSGDFIERHKKGLKPSWRLLGWLYEKEKNTLKYKDYTFFYDKTLEYSVLKVKKDPGVPVVYAGCFLIMIGLVLAFYINHIIIRICIVKSSDEKNLIYIGCGRKEDGSPFIEEIKREA
jgi:cytochrome c biogenesis protein